MFRKLIFLASALMLTFGMTFLIISNNERTKIDNVLNKDTYFFPLDKIESSSKQTNDLLEKFLSKSKKNHVNLYVYYYSSDNKRQVFLDIQSHNKSSILNALNVDEQYETKRKFFDRNNELEVFTLNSYTEKVKQLPNAIYMQGTEGNLAKYISEISQFSPEISLDKLEEVNLQQPVLTNKVLYVLLILLLIPIVMSLLFNFFNQYKQIMIYMINGLTKRQIMFSLIKKDYLLILIILVGGVGLTTLFMTARYQFWFILTICILSVGFLLASLISLVFISKFKVDYQYLYNKKPLKKLYQTNMIVQIISLIGLTFFIQNMSEDVHRTVVQRFEESQIKDQLKEYTSSLRISAGVDDENDKLVYESFIKSNKLFDEWLDRGLILFYLTGDTVNRLAGMEYENEFGANEVLITPEYLKKNPLLDDKGQAIAITENETSIIQLAPETLRKNEKELRLYLEEDHNFINREVALAFAERGAIKVEEIKHSPIEIIYIKNNQSFLTYHPEQKQLENPMFRVITKNNRSNLSVYADNIMGDSSSFFIKKSEKYRINETFDIDPNNHLNDFSNGISAINVLINNNQDRLRSMYPIIGIVVLIVLVFINTLVIHISSFFELQKNKLIVLTSIGYHPLYLRMKAILLIVGWFSLGAIVNLVNGHQLIGGYYLLLGLISVLIFLIACRNDVRRT